MGNSTDKNKIVIRKKILIFLFLFFPILSLPAYSQDNNAKAFFNEGFVVKKEPKKDVKKEINKDTGFTEFEEVTREDELEDLKDKVKSPFPENEKEMRKVLYIKAFINADDLEHFKEQKEIIEDFCLKNEIQLMNFYAVCNNCDRYEVDKLHNAFYSWILGGEFYIISKIPINYISIEKSPSYVIGLKKGEIILEGKDLLEKYIYKNGYYLGDLEKDKKLTLSNN